MTCLVTILVFDRLNLKLDEIKAVVSSYAANMIGTSSFLKKRDRLTIMDLLYGLMLPSGNDSAMTLA